MTFPTGHIDDPDDLILRRVGLHILAARHERMRAVRAAPLPRSTNNRAKLDPSNGGPGILDQGSGPDGTLSCEGHSHAAAATLRLALQGTPTKLLSPIAPYQGALMVGTQPNPDGTLPPLNDTGTESNLVQVAMREWGMPTAEAWGNYPASARTITNWPNLSQLEAAQECRYDGSYYIQSIGDRRLLDLMTALAAEFPVVDSMQGGGATFQGYTGGVLGMLDGPIDHSTYLLDYEGWDGTNLESVVWWGATSWGRNFGEGGLYRCNRHHINQIIDLEVMDIRRLS